MKVGVFDSGIGGLTVVKSLLQNKLFEEIVYYGDTARVPYGAKDKNTIVRYSLEALEFFKNFDIDILIVACNSASAYALHELKEVASVPVVGVIEPGIIALENSISRKDASILILGTQATIRSQKYENLLLDKGYTQTTSIATGLFVSVVEEGLFEGPVLQSTLQHYLQNIQTPDGIILGCTHFPLIATEIASYFHDKPLMIHSGDAIVQYLQNNFQCDRNFENTTLHFFASQDPDGLKSIAKKWLEGLI